MQSNIFNTTKIFSSSIENVEQNDCLVQDFECQRLRIQSQMKHSFDVDEEISAHKLIFPNSFPNCFVTIQKAFLKAHQKHIYDAFW